MAVANALGQRRLKRVTAAPWMSPLMAWSSVCNDYFRVADHPGGIAWFFEAQCDDSGRTGYSPGLCLQGRVCFGTSLIIVSVARSTATRL